MNNLTEEASDKLPVFVVMGQNWACEVKLEEKDLVLNGEDYIRDEDRDLIFTYDLIAAEAATKAIEIFKGIKPAENFELLDKDSEPFVGGVLYVFLKDGNPDKGHYIPTFIAFGNGGFYNDAAAAFKLFLKEMKAAQKDIKPKKTLKKTPVKKNIKKKNK